MTELSQALEAFKPSLIERFSEMVRYSFSQMTNHHGPALRGISNSGCFARMWMNTVRPCTKRETDNGICRLDSPYEISEERLLKQAKFYAETVVESWKAKIEAKMGELENPSVKSMTGGTFVISGTKFGKKVCIEQTTILKSSTKGLLFNQFPARIYVDGKFTSEAAYKKIAA